MDLKIGMLLDAFYPNDIRVYKEATALIQAGYEVHLLCKKRKGEKIYEEVDGIKVHRINAGKSTIAKGLVDIITAVNFVNPFFLKALPQFIAKNKINVLHIHDLPLFKTGFTMKSKYNVKVVVDFHENYPEALKVWFSWKKNKLLRLKNRLFFSYNRWKYYEAFAVKKADYIIAVVEEMKNRLLEQQVGDEAKIFVVTNTEEKSFANSPVDENIYGHHDDYIITYTGNIGPHRGVDTAIKAMMHLKDKPNVKLYLVGGASKSVMEKLNKLIEDNGVGDRVKLLGYQPFAKFFSFMKMADINIIPHHSNDHTNNTVPHKLFQAMMAGKPVIVSSSSSLKRIINETGAGLVFEAGQASDFADKVNELYTNEKLSRALGANGLKATLQGSYNWEATSNELIALYRYIETCM